VARAQAAELVRYLLEPERRAAFRALLARLRASEPADDALAAVFPTDGASLEQTFRADIARRYGSLPALLAGAAVWALLGAIALARFLRRGRAARDLAMRQATGRRETSAAPLSKVRKHIRFFQSRSDTDAAPLSTGATARDGGDRPDGPTRPRRGLRVITLGGREIEEQVEVSGVATPEPDVPKVEHEGRWHTLH
jgi:hypothetical protein